MRQSKSGVKKPSSGILNKVPISCRLELVPLRVWPKVEEQCSSVAMTNRSRLPSLGMLMGLVPTLKEQGSVLISEDLIRKIMTEWLRMNSLEGSLKLISTPRSQKIKDRSTRSQRRWFLEATRRDQKTIRKRVREYMLWESSGIPALDVLDEQDYF